MQSLLILTTGGTIDKIYFDDKSDYQVGDPQIGRILRELGVVIPFTVVPPVVRIRSDCMRVSVLTTFYALSAFLRLNSFARRPSQLPQKMIHRANSSSITGKGHISGVVHHSLMAWQKYSKAATPPQYTAEGRRNTIRSSAGRIGAKASPVATDFGKITEGESQLIQAVIQMASAMMPKTAKRLESEARG